MPSRTTPLVTTEMYHVFNRGVAKLPIFRNVHDKKHFIRTMLYYQLDCIKPKLSHYSPQTYQLPTDKKLVSILCYCLMPNHFHFLIKQTKDGGISEFISKLTNSYTKYFNTKHERIGPLFQGGFKAVHIENDEQCLHISRYIHLNPVVSYLVKDLSTYLWSSYQEYINCGSSNVCDKKIILEQFRSENDYKQFVLDQEKYAKQLDYIKHLTLE